MVATLTGQPNRIPLFAWVAAAALLFSGLVRGDDREDRDRKARAALALTAPAAPKVSAAPAPKAKSVAYGDAYKRASAEQQPLVVYVGTPMEPVPGAVVSWTDSFGDTKGPAVVVGYPVGDRLYVHATLPGAPTAEAVQREVKAAAKKADPKPMPPREVKDSPAPRPLDWQIRADVERPDARTELDVLRDSFVTVGTLRAGGSGVVAYSEPGRSLIFTCWHVIQDGSAVTVRSGGAVLPARVVEVDRTADVALLEVSRELPAVPAVQFESPAAGEPVLMLGAASIWSRGKLTASPDDRTFPSATGDFLGTQGDSGGPVFVRGQLVGLVRGKSDEGAKVSTCLGAMLSRGIRREKPASGTTASGPGTTANAPKAVADCPNGKCQLGAAPVLLPSVTSGGCAGGNCQLPSYAPSERRGLFRR